MMICAKEFGQGDATTSAPALDKNASRERICAMPFGYLLGEFSPAFNTLIPRGAE